jgi:shikimate kinase
MQQARNLFLVGLMGAGKTTIGRLLARRLKRSFYDSDHEIEQRCGVEIAVIFDIEGETGFRVRESQIIEELSALDGVVLATGGGAVLDPQNRKRLASRGTVLYLHALPEALHQRVRHDRKRPLLVTADPRARLEQLYAQRDPLYREIADWVVETGQQSATALARELIGRLRQEWKLSA